ncbi:outer membrane beta-barrel protein [Roseibacterium beibuensis]|uniref:Outer membrane beta-barrel protein n=1 Tax=[Roseibacterium] beibuensis TaxID=1193142 RepID=A0ABP9L4Y6_9RHOB|nr:outer membrane beta-barrel protein [Roseibacterium beibuensis]MCS6621343.1 outer membrane beta-barrel protein [Roseibacterium beibuensis]
MNSTKLAKFSATALLAGTCTAFAGGVVETPPPVTIVTPPPAFDWTGAYVGGSLGLAFGDYGNDADFPGDGEGDLDGHAINLLAGYTMQSGSFVYGGEVHIGFADISGSEECVNPAFECAAEIDMLASLRGRVGYLLSDNTQVYGNLGLAAANVDVYTDGPIGRNGTEETLGGFTIGVGLEHAISDNMTFFGSVQHYMFEEDDYQTDVLYNNVDIDFTTVEIGMTFRF